MATVAGAVLAAYIGFLGGDDPALRLVYAKHLLAASVMAAPGAIVISKILYPQTENINTEVAVSQEKIGSVSAFNGIFSPENADKLNNINKYYSVGDKV